MVERFGVDACVPPRKRDAEPPIPIADEDKFAPSPMPDTILGAWLQPAQSGSSTDVAVVRGGVPVAQGTLVQLEIGTRNSPTGTNWSDSYPSLFLSHTPLHFVAVHNGSGTFNAVIKHRLDSHTLKRVKARQQTGFKRLRLALKGIQELVVARGREGRLSLVCEDGRMQVYERVSVDDCVPKDILARFYPKA
ncbi:hypothetical protein A0H81_08811 [Grifola frondosa]|uniref:Uncharacterized protein n=1 Tax=Grifola frondosa TaxID=5627 RepID=A0A1C7M434_GRIFR|nr:hypothetical protein A0H81_08811 [Grifola frondosa]